MSKRIINKINVFIFFLILLFYSFSNSIGEEDNFKIENWIEDIPILASLIERKKDVVEFDSSNGKIISISFDSKNLSKKQIYLFYKVFFKNKNWKKDKDKNIWVTKNKTFKKKIFKIENFKDELLTIKIITENF